MDQDLASNLDMQKIGAILLDAATHSDQCFALSPFFWNYRLVEDMVTKGCHVKLVVRLCSATSAAELRYCLENPGVEVRYFTSPSFHSKCYCYDHLAVVGSANLTHSGMASNHEMCLICRDDSTLREINKVVHDCWQRAEPLTDAVLADFSTIQRDISDRAAQLERELLDSLGNVSPHDASGDISVDHIAKRDTDLARKRLFWDFVVREAPALLEANGGQMLKQHARRYFEDHYKGELPDDLSNAYGHAFKILCQRGVTLPARQSAHYRLKSGR